MLVLVRRMDGKGGTVNEEVVKGRSELDGRDGWIKLGRGGGWSVFFRLVARSLVGLGMVRSRSRVQG